jgi:hypothetical protein
LKDLERRYLESLQGSEFVVGNLGSGAEDIDSENNEKITGSKSPKHLSLTPVKPISPRRQLFEAKFDKYKVNKH